MFISICSCKAHLLELKVQQLLEIICYFIKSQMNERQDKYNSHFQKKQPASKFKGLVERITNNEQKLK